MTSRPSPARPRPAAARRESAGAAVRRLARKQEPRSVPRPSDDVEELRARLAEAEENLRAIRAGEVDAVVVAGPQGEQVYTLKDADRSYRVIIESMLEGTVTVDADGGILYANRQLARMLHAPLSSLIGSAFQDHVDASDRAKVRDLLRSTTARGRKSEVRLKTATGGDVQALVSFSRAPIEGGPVSIGVIADISEQKRAEAGLRETTARLERLFGATDILLAILGADLCFQQVNDGFARTFGRSTGAFSGLDYAAVIPPGRLREALEAAASSGRTVREYGDVFPAGAGAARAWDWSVQPVKSGEGEIQAVILSLIDATERKETEEARRELDAAVEQAVDAVVITDLQGAIVYANRSYEKVRHAAPGALVGRRFALLGDDPQSAEVRAGLERDGTWSGELGGESGGGYDFQATISALRDDEGRVIRYVAILHDITERMRLEKQVQSLQRTEALGRLAGGIAHDLNNILFPIILNTEWLLSETDPGTPRHKALDEILRAANRQRNLVKQILTFGRKRDQELRPVQVGPLLEDAVSFMRSSLPATIEIRRQNAAARDTVMGDPDQVRQIIVNLCQNAAEAMGPNGGVLEISLADLTVAAGQKLAGLKPGPWLRLSVKDSGRGIPTEDLDRIFDPFFTTKEAGQGTGLGLPIVYGIVKGLGGTIAVESRKGKGTRFDIYLPVVSARPAAAAREAGPAAAREEGGRILIVDDEALILESAEHALKMLGYQVTAISDSVKALATFKARPCDFDLVIVDQTMPRMTGAQMAPELRTARPEIPIILMTGYSQVIDEEKARSLGIRQMLMKPMSIADLSGAVARALKKS